MKKFEEFQITTTKKAFVGEKIKLDRIINCEITVFEFKVEPSIFKEKGDRGCLHLQIEFSGEKRVFFSGSSSLIEMIQQVAQSDFPFSATIVRAEDKMLRFT